MAQLNFVTLMNTLWAWQFSQLSICLIVHLCKWHLLALIQIYPKFIALAIWKTRALLKSKHTISTDFPLHRTIGLIAKGNLVSQTRLILTDSMIAIYNNLVLHIAKNDFKEGLLHTLCRNWPGSFLFFLEMFVTTVFFQSLGSFPVCQDFWKMTEIILMMTLSTLHRFMPPPQHAQAMFL